MSHANKSDEEDDNSEIWSNEKANDTVFKTNRQIYEWRNATILPKLNNSLVKNVTFNIWLINIVHEQKT